METTDTAFKTAVWSGCTPRLLRADNDREDAAEYRDQGGYLPLVDTDQLLGEVESGGLVAARWSSRMAKRENRLRSRTAGCCVTGHTWFWTDCGWLRRSCPPTVPTSMCPIRIRRGASRPRSTSLSPPPSVVSASMC